jgi:hypothetical protein
LTQIKDHSAFAPSDGLVRSPFIIMDANDAGNQYDTLYTYRCVQHGSDQTAHVLKLDKSFKSMTLIIKKAEMHNKKFVEWTERLKKRGARLIPAKDPLKSNTDERTKEL